MARLMLACVGLATPEFPRLSAARSDTHRVIDKVEPSVATALSPLPESTPRALLPASLPSLDSEGGSGR
jgi:hypothetical protein